MKKARGSSALDRKVKAKGGSVHFLPSPALSGRIAQSDPPGSAEIDAVAHSVAEALDRHEQGKGERIKKL